MFYLLGQGLQLRLSDTGYKEANNDLYKIFSIIHVDVVFFKSDYLL